jgi:hypothetical protein
MSFTTHPSVLEVLQVPGYLFWSPTNLSAEATWGTKLGFCENGINFYPNIQIQEITEEDRGVEITHKIYLGMRPKITAVLQNWNTTLMARLFPGMTSGASLLVPSRSSILTGADLTGSAYVAPVLFVPQDTTRDPVLLGQKASPNVDESAVLNFSATKRVLFSIVFDLIRKTTDADGTFYMGLLSGATLR